MRLASIICFCAATVQLFAGVLLVVFNAPSALFGMSLGVSPWLSVGAVLVISGLATYVAGTITGVLGARSASADNGVKVFAALNGAFLALLLVLGAFGFVVHRANDNRMRERMAAYEQERGSKDLRFAASFAHAYHQNLWDQRVLLLTTSELSAKMLGSEIAGFKLVIVPEPDRKASAAAQRLLGDNDYFKQRFVRQLLEADDRAAFAAMKSLFKDCHISYSIDLEKADGGYKTLRDDDFDWFAKRDVVIARIKAKQELDDKYRTSATPTP